MRKFSTNNPLLFTFGVVFVFALWFLISLAQGQTNFVFPSPVATFSTLVELLGTVYLWQSIGMTLLRTVEGFLAALSLALVLGVLAGELTWLQPFFKPLIITLKSAPTAAFVFFFILVSGTTRAPIWIVGLLAFPILYEAVVAGFNAVPSQMIWAARIDQASPFRRITKITLPLAFPYLLLGMLNSFALSLKTEIMAEIITGSTNPGLGGAIRSYRNIDATDLAPIFAIAVIAIAIILLFDLLSFLAKRLFADRLSID